jgi:leucyl-tRNA---protein transferase
MSVERNPRVIPPPAFVPELGPLVVVDGECAYYDDKRPTCTAFALPGFLSGQSYQAAMDLGMRRSGAVVYRPLCRDCRRCQPLRIRVDGFRPSRSQRRVARKCDTLFETTVQRPILDDEHLDLYGRYQVFQHGDHAQSADYDSYQRFLIDTVTETIEVSWRDQDGALIGVGILDVTPDVLSSVYFFWDPKLANLSLGIYSMLQEIDLCRQWNKKYYYVGYLVSESKSMKYKADFENAEVWNGSYWTCLPERGVGSAAVQQVLLSAEQGALQKDGERFSLGAARSLPVMDSKED